MDNGWEGLAVGRANVVAVAFPRATHASREALPGPPPAPFPQALPASLGWRMAVLPFRAVGDAAAQGIALGVAEEVSAALARFPAPRLVATATFWAGDGPVADAVDRCRAYQVDYAIDGTVQVAGDEVRVSVALVDVVLGSEVLWAKRFSGGVADLFRMQDRIAAEIVAQVDPEAFEGRWDASAPGGTRVAAAHHQVLRAIEAMYGTDRGKFMQARALLEHAVELDAQYAAAHAWLAYWGVMAAGQGWVESPRDVTASAGASAGRAVALDPSDARAIAVAGHVKAYLEHDVPAALALHAQAIELNRNLPIAWTLSSWSKLYSGCHSTAVSHAGTALSLSPADPHMWLTEHALMTARFFLRELDEAWCLASAVLGKKPGNLSALNVLLAILGHAGRRKEAAQCLAELQAINPTATVASIVARPPLQKADRDFYADCLRRAGVPD